MQILTGKIYFHAQGAAPEKLLNECRRRQLPLSHLQAAEIGFTGCIAERYYAAFVQTAQKCGCEITVQTYKKPLLSADFFTKRWGRVCGVLLMLWVIAGCNRMVWAIRFDGLNIVQQQEIRRQLHENGICEGAWVDQQTLAAAHSAIMQQGDYGWLTLNFYRGRLIVEKSDEEKAPAIEESRPSDIYSAVDGVITEMKVTSGDVLCFQGQQIAKGQLLVSGRYTDRDGKVITAPSKGEIYAQVKCSYQASQPLEQTVQLAQSTEMQNTALFAFGKRIPLFSTESTVPTDIVKQSQVPLQIFGFALPATLERTQVTHTQNQTVTLTHQQAAELAKMSCRNQLEQDFPSALVQAEATQMQVEEGVVTLNVTFTAVVQAGIQKNLAE